jgi:hypothetical protein
MDVVWSFLEVLLKNEMFMRVVDLLIAVGTIGLAVVAFCSMMQVKRIQKESVRPHLILNMFLWADPPDEYVIHIENLGKWYAFNIRGKLSYADERGISEEQKLEISKNLRLSIDEVGEAYVRFNPRGKIFSYKQFHLRVEYDGISEFNLSQELTTNLNAIKTINYQKQSQLFAGRPEVELGRTIIDLDKE